jgi:uncharacterized protein (TIGR00369 family)
VDVTRQRLLRSRSLAAAHEEGHQDEEPARWIHSPRVLHERHIESHGARISVWSRVRLRPRGRREATDSPPSPALRGARVAEGNFFHAAGAIHGSIYFKALDAAFFAVNSLVSDVFVLTVSYNVYLLRQVSEGTLMAKGRAVHCSRQLFAEAELFDDRSREVARGSGSFMRSTIALTPGDRVRVEGNDSVH